MNWFKQAQTYPPIAIVSYFPSYGELGISFNGGKKYTYYDINPDNHAYLKSLLKNKNYEVAESILRSWGKQNEETEEDKQEILNELYERGILGNKENNELV